MSVMSILTLSPEFGNLMPDLITATTPQERLLALGRILVVLPKVVAKDRRPVQEWIRGSFEAEYIQLAHRFAVAPLAYSLKCMVEEVPLSRIAEELMK